MPLVTAIRRDIRELGMAGHAGDCEPLSLEDMKARHASGLRAAA